VFVMSWNTDSVPEGSQPTSWEDLADPRWKGRLVLEVDDIEWYSGLHQHWIESGKSDAEADALFEAMAANARFVKGHSLMAQLLASGEFDVAASPFLNGVRRLQAKGAPIAFEPLVEPLIATPSGVAIVEGAAHPAAAVLFADWLLTDAQELFAGLDIIAARKDLQTVGDAVVLNVDLSALGEDFEMWRDRYGQLSDGQAVIDDEG
jgi:iron(III) transport system substrate-binding protein